MPATWARFVIAIGCVSCTLMSCGDESAVPRDPEECLEVCAETPVYEACAPPQTIGFVRCLQENGCGEAASDECQIQAIYFGRCLTRPDG